MKTYKNPYQLLRQKLCRRPKMEQSGLDEVVQSIFTEVEKGGDNALRQLTERFDGVKLSLLVLSQQEVKAQARKVPIKLQRAIDTAFRNIHSFHELQVLDVQRERLETMPGVMCWRESRPIERVGLYVPGGSAPLTSTVLMLGVPAQIAGCQEVVLCTPPNKDVSVEPAICYAAQLCGIDKIYTVGGAQAIAAMTFGTKSVPKVDKIFGPGNQYVMAAKQYAVKYGLTIDMPAGPSEVMVLADASANPAFVAADLLGQAEHGSDSQVVLVTTQNQLVPLIEKELKLQLANLPRKEIAAEALKNSFSVVFDNLKRAIEFVNSYAPEHLILSVKNPEQLAAGVSSAGSVFLGNYSPESAGDYASGTNHTLPTNGWARSYGGLSLDSFVKKVTFQSLSKLGLKRLSQTITTMAEAEGLQAHANAVNIRFNNKL
ncbi:MAG: histidinol dehydrogenase [Patescibacteria group bacterium]